MAVRISLLVALSGERQRQEERKDRIALAEAREQARRQAEAGSRRPVGNVAGGLGLAAVAEAGDDGR